MALASIFVLAGPVREARAGLAVVPVFSVDLRLAAARPGPRTALLAIPSTEPATTPCTWGKRARKEASPRPWVRTEALDTAVLFTSKDVS